MDVKKTNEVFWEIPDDKKVATLLSLKESDKPELVLSEGIFKEASKIQWENPSLSWKGLRFLAVKEYRRLGEASASSAFGQLLRAGIQTIANGWYLRVEPSWKQFVSELASNKRQEFYAPLYNSQLPRRTGEGERYSENRLAGVDREIVNYKYMGGESFTREMFDDDQTGQIKQRAQNLGARLVEGSVPGWSYPGDLHV